MKREEAVKNYQCSGCVSGDFGTCYVFQKNNDMACANHCAGTRINGVGKILLGLPVGFNRMGFCEKMQLCIFSKFEHGWGYDKFNIPVWKHLDEFKNTIVRGISPRTNSPFIHIFLENCISKVNCIEITEQEIQEMD